MELVAVLLVTSAEGAELRGWLQTFVRWWPVCLARDTIHVGTILRALCCYKCHWVLRKLPGRCSGTTETSQTNIFGRLWQPAVLPSHPSMSGWRHRGATATSAWQTTPGARWPLSPAAGARCVLWPLAGWHVARRAELCCTFGSLWNGRKWRSCSAQGFGHERWKMWITGIPVLSLLEITGSTYWSAWLAEGLKKQGGALKIKPMFYNQEHILYPAQALQVSHPSRQKGVAGAKLIILQFNFGVEQQCKASGLLNPVNNVP